MTDEFLKMPGPIGHRGVEGPSGPVNSGEPFEHVVIEQFTDPNFLREVVAAIESIPRALWTNYFFTNAQVGKSWIDQLGLIPEPARTFISNFNAPPMVKMMSELMNIEGLIPDPKFLGGGLHSIDRGGRLEIHADFSFNPEMNLHRRVNALLYLNEDWEDDWGGHLELWDKEMSHCVRKYAPIFNRMVVFPTTDTAFHGHPHPLNCPPHRRRLSIALYYYTATRPENESFPHLTTLWQNRP